MVNALNASLRKEASRILQENLVDVVIGFQAGSLPMTAQPAFVRRAGMAGILINSGFGATNLALYLTRRRHRSERIGLVCRGCESRAVRVLTGERQHVREALYLIGIPCKGIIDRRRIEAEAGPHVLSAEEIDAEVVVTTRSGEYRFLRSEVLHGACRQCRFPHPVGVDITVGELPRERADSLQEGGALSAAEAGTFIGKEPCGFESLTADERYAEFTRRAERCIRCYACRQACPMCYCTQCFVDSTTPRWTESTVGRAGAQAWHIMRAFHQTGRCVGCGACERACPMGIKMRALTDKLNRDMERSYGFVPGKEEIHEPPFAAFSMDDANRFGR